MNTISLVVILVFILVLHIDPLTKPGPLEFAPAARLHRPNDATYPYRLLYRLKFDVRFIDELFRFFDIFFFAQIVFLTDFE